MSEPAIAATDSRTAPSSQGDAGWDEEVDVAVVGFGGAGAAAAIEAAESGARTLVVERFMGGGATRMSGGIYYAGGGTEPQRAAGYEDTADELFHYLRCETDGEAVSDDVLRAFADASLDNFEWLRAQGVPFPVQGFPPIKTSYPSDDTTLYYSGNEKSPPYCDRAVPAPRGHRALGGGLTGAVLYEPLRAAARAAGAQLRYRSRATRLVADERGAVIGLEIAELSASWPVRALHTALFYVATHGGALSSLVLGAARKALEALETRCSRTHRVRVRGGVVIAAGGFIFNANWTRRYLPRYAKNMRLGTAGDDGSGIALGRSVGAGLRKMERGTAWMFINPPAGLTKGVLLDRDGERICNEELYGATLGERIAELHAGGAVLILDREAWSQARDEILHGHKALFQSVIGLVNLYINNHRAPDLEALERKLAMPVGNLVESVRRYNEGARAGKDELGKSADYLQPLETGPYYAIDCDTANRLFLTPSITLGGLDVDGLSAQVLREDHTPIAGLYAAGRSAVGVCSQHYVSGLSIADGVFAGRVAGRSAARAALHA